MQQYKQDISNKTISIYSHNQMTTFLPFIKNLASTTMQLFKKNNKNNNGKILKY